MHFFEFITYRNERDIRAAEHKGCSCMGHASRLMVAALRCVRPQVQWYYSWHMPQK